jgi:hypothetical protein
VAMATQMEGWPPQMEGWPPQWPPHFNFKNFI